MGNNMSTLFLGSLLSEGDRVGINRNHIGSFLAIGEEQRLQYNLSETEQWERKI